MCGNDDDGEQRSTTMGRKPLLRYKLTTLTAVALVGANCHMGHGSDAAGIIHPPLFAPLVLVPTTFTPAPAHLFPPLRSAAAQTAIASATDGAAKSRKSENHSLVGCLLVVARRRPPLRSSTKTNQKATMLRSRIQSGLVAAARGAELRGEYSS